MIFKAIVHPKNYDIIYSPSQLVSKPICWFFCTPVEQNDILEEYLSKCFPIDSTFQALKNYKNKTKKDRIVLIK